MTWKPGESGNPNGRPKRFLTQHLIAELNEIDAATEVVKARGLIVALIDKAMTGDVAAAKEVLDRVEGKVPQVLAGDPENPLALLLKAEQTLDQKFDRLLTGTTAETSTDTFGS